ncbi:MAG: hypothetical protein RLZZ336_1389 [Cyanobacteriota bacterium]|jgi:hypothetical protein
MEPTLLALVLAQATAAPGTGQFLLNGTAVQQVAAQLVTYVGDCPGDGQDEIRGVSFLTPVPPAPYQRIVIRNDRTGGFTDREYDERRPSAEAFNMALGSGQRGSALTLSEGVNSFTYVVRNRLSNTELGQGTATLAVSVNRITRNRSFSQIKEERYCLGNRSSRYGSLEKCADGLITVERTGVCPNGGTRTLSLETVRLRRS